MCSYCGCRSISLVGRFMDEHEDIVNAAGILHRAADGTDSHGVRESLEASGAWELLESARVVLPSPELPTHPPMVWHSSVDQPLGCVSRMFSPSNPQGSMSLPLLWQRRPQVIRRDPEERRQFPRRGQCRLVAVFDLAQRGV